MPILQLGTYFLLMFQYILEGITVRQTFLSNRVFDDWNALPQEVVLAESTLILKSKYDAYCINQRTVLSNPSLDVSAGITSHASARSLL